MTVVTLPASTSHFGTQTVTSWSQAPGFLVPGIASGRPPPLMYETDGDQVPASRWHSATRTKLAAGKLVTPLLEHVP